MISVIIPTYNRKEVLLRAIDSVLQQTWPDLECIIVDDGSTDGTQEAVQSLADERIRYVRQDNRGACAARNRGVELAKGEIIAFQDSDDVWHVDKLQRQMALLEEKQADVVVCEMHRVGENEARQDWHYQPVGWITQEMLLRESLCSTQCILGRAEVFRDMRFDETMPRLQDWDLMLRIVGAWRVYKSPDVLVDVYLQQDSISNQPKKLLDALIKLYCKHHQAICSLHGDRLPYGSRLDRMWMRNILDAAERCGASPWTQEMMDAAPHWVVRPGQTLPENSAVLCSDKAYAPEGVLPVYMTVPYVNAGPEFLLLPPEQLPDVLHRMRGKLRFGRGPYPTAGNQSIITGLRSLPPCMAWELLTAEYGLAPVAAELPETMDWHTEWWAGVVRRDELPCRGGPIRRVGVYYHDLAGGGAQRAALQQMQTFLRLGLQVVALTGDEKDAERVGEGVAYRHIACTRERMNIRDTSPGMGEAGRRADREHVLQLAEAAKDCDVLIYHAWADRMLLSDLLAVKSTGCRFVVHTHSVFAMPLMEMGMQRRFARLAAACALSDGVIALSDADAAYWRTVGVPVWKVLHPLTFRPETTPVNALDGQTVLWVGRFSQEKHPERALDIMRAVHARLPGARFILVGKGDVTREMYLKDTCIRQGLTGVVEMPGWQEDMAPLYARADVLLCTSDYEGYGLAMAEAATFGVPCVAFDMPWLPTQAGALTVPGGDMPGMENALVRILTDEKLRRELGRKARANAESCLDVDGEAQWQAIFREMEAGNGAVLPPQDANRVMMDTLRGALQGACGPGYIPDWRQTLPPAGWRSSGMPPISRFVPMPVSGPCKKLRKKAATFLEALLIEGWPGVRRIFREKREQREMRDRFFGIDAEKEKT